MLLAQDNDPRQQRQQLRQKLRPLRLEGRTQEATRIQRQIVALYEKDPTVTPLTLAAVRRRLAYDEEMLGRFKVARELRQRVLKTRMTWLPANHRDVAEARRELADLDRFEKFDDKQIESLRLARQLSYKAVDLWGRQRAREALLPAREALKHAEVAYGKDHPDYAMFLYNLASQLHALRQFGEAEKWYRQSEALWKRTLGERDPHYAKSLNSLGVMFMEKGDLDKAQPLLEQAATLREQVVGVHHQDYWLSLDNLAHLAELRGTLEKATSILRRQVKLVGEATNKLGSDYEQALHNLAMTFERAGEIDQALATRKDLIQVTIQRTGPNHPDVADQMFFVGRLLKTAGRYEEAERVLRGLEQVYRRAGDRYRYLRAHVLRQLGDLYGLVGDDRQALPMLQEALETLRDNPEPYAVATALNTLAMQYERMGRSQDALPLYEQALAIDMKLFAPNNPRIWAAKHQLAVAYRNTNQLKKAAELFKEVLAFRKEHLGTSHPEYGETLNSLAVTNWRMAQFERALPLFRESLDILIKTRGKSHPDYVGALTNLAMQYVGLGDWKAAEPLLREAADWALRHLETMAGIQSQRQQLASMDAMRDWFDFWIAASQRVNVDASDVYSRVLRWKGLVFNRQFALRRMRDALRGGGDELAQKLYDDYVKATMEIGRLTFGNATSKTEAAARDRHLRKLTAQRESIERKFVEHLGDTAPGRLFQTPTPQQVRDALPKDAALVDLMAYKHPVPPGNDPHAQTEQWRVVAFVLRRGQPVRRVELGPGRPLYAAISQWRDLIAAGKDDRAAAQLVHQHLWAPLQPAIEHAHIVMVAGEAWLMAIPFAALPGRGPGRYLIEDLAVVAVPSPGMLPHWLAPQKPAAPSLLAIGGVDYNADPGEHATTDTAAQLRPHPASRGVGGSVALDGHTGGNRWQALKSTRMESDVIVRAFGKRFKHAPVDALVAADAIESTVRRLAPGRRYIHLATHGFFAAPSRHVRGASRPAQLASTSFDVRAWNPGLASGVVLAGANKQAQEGHDDGYFTALDVAELDLHTTQTVVLSACQTGLGESARGEQLLGLQRAFHLAGAQSVVASLWKVDDAATAVLMKHFYSNLWAGKRSTLESLRQAQLDLLRARIDPAELRGIGGAVPIQKLRTPAGRLHPRLWAAWVLSGSTGDVHTD